jgi:hypothetical protein
MELEESEIAVGVASFDVVLVDVVVLDPVSKFDDSVEVGAALEVGEVSRSELCIVAVLEGVLVSLFAAQHAGVPSG